MLAFLGVRLDDGQGRGLDVVVVKVFLQLVSELLPHHVVERDVDIIGLQAEQLRILESTG